MNTTEARQALNEAIEQGIPLHRVSRLYARYMLVKHNDNKLRASDALGIDRRTLQRWTKAGMTAESEVSNDGS